MNKEKIIINNDNINDTIKILNNEYLCYYVHEINFNMFFNIKLLLNYKHFFNKYANLIIAFYCNKIGDYRSSYYFFIKSYILGLNYIPKIYFKNIENRSFFFIKLLEKNKLNKLFSNYKLNKFIYYKSKK